MPKQHRKNRITFAHLAEQPAIEVAVDTEFKGIHTLTVQAAGRVRPDHIAVQVYRAQAVPRLPDSFELAHHAKITTATYGPSCRHVVLRPVRLIEPTMSPVRLVSDLFGIPDTVAHSRREGLRRLEGAGGPDGPPNATWQPRSGQWTVPTIRVVLIGHFLTADFARLFGRAFHDDLLRPNSGDALSIREGKVIGYIGPGPMGAFVSPIVQYVEDRDGALYALRLEWRDTMLPFGPASLDRLCRTFLGLGKLDGLDQRDKEDMLRTFRKKTEQAHAYAIVDAVHTLLVHEAMTEQDRRIYTSFGVPREDVPPMRLTLGSRVAQFLSEMTSRTAAAGSVGLSKVSRLKELMRRGGPDAFSGSRRASRFGAQTGRIHGGLNFSRTPTKFWHEAPGMIRDIDMSGCYNAIIQGLHVYWGQPILFEPGRRAGTLREAVELVSRHADPDAWYIRVTGELARGINVLIPSTLDARTAANFHGTRRTGPDCGGSKLFARRIESGIVTRATWLMIQMLPPALRRDYEQLTAESIVLYPRKLVAPDGPSFDRLVETHRATSLPWEGRLDLRSLTENVVEHFGAEYVSLKFPIGRYARQIGEFRREARGEHGKDSGPDTAWKLQANTMYGVLCSPHLATANVVAANQVTATARALAFALVQALNGFQVITDGCTYRRDQIPACSLARCLALQPDYPLRRAEAGSRIPFHDPGSVPEDDEAFTRWYRDEHLPRFLGVRGKSHAELFRIHDLAHKACSDGRTLFDGLACDGGSNYVKCRLGEADWQVLDMAMRGYGRASKAILQDWILPTYSADRLEAPAPVTEDLELLKLKPAKRKARRALNAGIPEVVLPLGLETRKLRTHKAIKHSAFVFQTPDQFKTLRKQIEKFESKTTCGLEVLALRRSYRGRPSGSIQAIAEEIYAHIQDGGRDLTKLLHLSRPFPALEELSTERRGQIERLRAEVERDLLTLMDPSTHPRGAQATGIIGTIGDSRPLS